MAKKNSTQTQTVAPKVAPKPKPKAKAPVQVETNGQGEYGAVRSKDLPWVPKKVAVFKALKALKALTPQSAVSSKAVAEQAGDLTERDVRHYCYHARAAGLVELTDDVEGVRGWAFYLTPTGRNVNPDKELTMASLPKAMRAPKGKAPKAPKCG